MDWATAGEGGMGGKNVHSVQARLLGGGGDAAPGLRVSWHLVELKSVSPIFCTGWGSMEFKVSPFVQRLV